VSDDKAAAAAAKDPAPAKDAGKAGGKPILLYLLLVINMAAMIGMGAMVFIGVKKQAAQPKIDDVINGEAKTQEEEKAKDEEFVGQMIPMEMFLVNLSGSHGRKLLKVNMELEVEGEKVHEEIEKRKPQIRDIIITLLSSKTYGQISTPEGKEFLREEVRDTVNSFLTKGKIKQVLFTEFIYN
jgi:flagellar FliL protein